MKPFSQIFDFEQDLASFTGAPFVVVTDCCTHAIELCMRYDQVKHCSFPAHTYLSIPQTLKHLSISYEMTDEDWTGEYNFGGTRIWDSARRLEQGMYNPGQLQCVSFGVSKPLHLGRGGAVLLDDIDAYRTLSRWRSDGRDLNITPWQTQETFDLGFHYCPTLELCHQGSERLQSFTGGITKHQYPDLRKLTLCP
jgi:dTDP-4-amino-4,6-dideoxygalactose transaminase